MRKNLLVSEVLTRVNNASSDDERIKILKDFETHALLYVLRNSFTPQITFDEIGVPEYNQSRQAIGLDFSSLHQEARRIYVLADDFKKITVARKREIFLQILEAIHASEARLLEQVVKKEIKVKGLTPELVEKTFPGLLSWQGETWTQKAHQIGLSKPTSKKESLDSKVGQDISDPLGLGPNDTKSETKPKRVSRSKSETP